jgi:hypothetical protein
MLYKDHGHGQLKNKKEGTCGSFQIFRRNSQTRNLFFL